MDAEIRAKLKVLLSQPDRDELLDDPRRLAELVRERLGAERKREAAFLNAVMQEGVPQRLLAAPATSLTAHMLDRYARSLSDATGLKEDVARWAVEAWADGLGMKIAGSPKPPAPAPLPKAPPFPQPASLPKSNRGTAIALLPAHEVGIRFIASAMAVWGTAILLFTVFATSFFFEVNMVWRNGLPMFLLGTANIMIGFLVALMLRASPAVIAGPQQAQASASSGISRAAVAACTANAVLCASVAGFVVVASGNGPWHSEDLIGALVACFGMLIFAPAAAALFRLRRTAGTSAAWTTATTIASLMLTGGLFGVWLLGGTLRSAGTAYALWLIANLPVALAMASIGARMLLVPSWSAPRRLVFGVCALNSACYLGDLAWWGRTMNWEYWLLDLIGIAAALAVVGLAWRAAAPAVEPRAA